MIHQAGATGQKGIHRRAYRAPVKLLELLGGRVEYVGQPQLQGQLGNQPPLPHLGGVGVTIDKARQQQLVLSCYHPLVGGDGQGSGWGDSVDAIAHQQDIHGFEGAVLEGEDRLDQGWHGNFRFWVLDFGGWRGGWLIPYWPGSELTGLKAEVL